MAAPARDWADPFLEQAREDLRAAYAISASKSASTLCMLLQMVFEKLGKAAHSRVGYTIARDHRYATKLFLILELSPAGSDVLQIAPNARQFLEELENATPSVANKSDNTSAPWPRLEYPWEDASGCILYPARDLALAKRVRNPNDRILGDCLKLASALEKQLFAIIQ